jgi:hypothetical protein
MSIAKNSFPKIKKFQILVENQWLNDTNEMINEIIFEECKRKNENSRPVCLNEDNWFLRNTKMVLGRFENNQYIYYNAPMI